MTAGARDIICLAVANARKEERRDLIGRPLGAFQVWNSNDDVDDARAWQSFRVRKDDLDERL